MGASPVVRSLRAAVFAALCVLLASGAHAWATGTAPPVWGQCAAVAVLFMAGFLLGGRERSSLGIAGATAAAQAGLHCVFDTARPHSAVAVHGMRMAHLHPHPLTPYTAVAHVGASVVLTWCLRRGEAALWSLLRWAAAFVPGLVAWWDRARRRRLGLTVPGPVRDIAGELRPLRQALLRHVVQRRGPPAGMTPAHAI
ncbi:hypothetical protein [Streptomyces sp. NBC_00145]|uniref:hypothetical protein n=1 Tax=Streptomyces sp. NBC_00145 TaxID=2975666 RepID=UPI002E18B443